MPGLRTPTSLKTLGRLTTRLPQWLPGLCEVCRSGCQGRLCTACTSRWAAPVPACARCALPTATALSLCGECLADAPPFVATVAAVAYRFPWDGLLTRLKFHGAVDLAPALAALLADAVQGALHAKADTSAPALPDLVLPVPLPAARLLSRGYNQAWELGRRVGAELGLATLAQGLERSGDTPPQTGLKRADRLHNLRNAFAVPAAAQAQISGRAVALVDDVMTTGATARVAAAALLNAGAASVQVWVVARTPTPAPAPANAP